MVAPPVASAAAFVPGTAPTLVDRLVNKTDFERLLAVRPRCRSAHFALHHVHGAPAQLAARAPRAEAVNLSTRQGTELLEPVDISVEGRWFGAVVPKRHARRAVTRNLLKRQGRSAFQRHAARLPAGLWLLRLREPFAVAQFVSARSAALALASRVELDALFDRAAA